MESSTAEVEKITEELLFDLFFEIEVDLEAARKQRSRSFDPQTLKAAMRATAEAHRKLRHAVDLSFAGGFDTRSIMDAAHLRFIETNAW